MEPHKQKKKDLPPKQYTRNKIMGWGTDHPGIVSKIPEINLKEWKLIIDGLVENMQVFSWEEFLNLPAIESTSDFHCVETWTVPSQRWTGVKFSDIIRLVKPKKEAKFIWIECLDGYTTSLELDWLVDDENLLAYKLDGKLLTKELGGPLRFVVPQKYAYKSAMYLARITFTKDNKLGYWEKKGYSNTADVWKNDRYSR